MLKKMCLASVSAIVFLSAFSTLTPSYSMQENEENMEDDEKNILIHDKKRKIEIQPETPACYPFDEKKVCMFVTAKFPRISPFVAQIIFSYLDGKSEGQARLVCKNWKFLCDKEREPLIKWFISKETWTSTPEDFLRRVFHRPGHFQKMLDLLDPFNETYSIRSNFFKGMKVPLDDLQTFLKQYRNESKELNDDKPISPTNLLKIRFYKKLQETLYSTGVTLGFFKENDMVDYRSLLTVLKNDTHHLQLRDHLKAIYLLRLCQDEETAAGKKCLLGFTTALCNVLSEIECIWEEVDTANQNNIKKQQIIKEEYSWFLKQKSLFAYTDIPKAWFEGFKLYDRLSLTNPPIAEAEKIYKLFSQLFANESFKNKDVIFENMRTILYELYELKDDFEKQISLYNAVESPTINELLTLSKAYMNSGKYKKSINIYERILKILEENKLNVIDKGSTASIQLYFRLSLLKEIFTSNIFSKYKKNSFNIVKELLNSTEETEKLEFKYEIRSKENQHLQFNCDIHISRERALFYQNCYKFLFKKQTILECLKPGCNPELLFDMVHNSSETFDEKELVELQEFFKKQIVTYLESVDECIGELREHQIKGDYAKKITFFIKKIFSTDLEFLKKCQKLVSEFFEEEKKQN